MQNNKDIRPRNHKEQPHGYWEVYWDNKLWYKRFLVNGFMYGYSLLFAKNKINEYYAK